MMKITTQHPPTKALNICLWIAQILLAALFGMAGFMKLTQPINELSKQMTFVNVFPQPVVRLIGICEIAAAIGLIIPGLLRIKQHLTHWAAIGLTIVMVLASIYHGLHGETNLVPINLILGASALFIAWGRFYKGWRDKAGF